jgi:hypothetical protein
MKKYIIWFLLISVGINIGLTAYLTQTLQEKNKLISELSSKLLPIKVRPVEDESDNTVNISFESSPQEIDTVAMIREINTLKQDVSHYRGFIDDLVSKMSKEEKEAVAENEWQYALEIVYYDKEGEIYIPVKDQMEIRQSHFTIKLSERRPANPITTDVAYLNLFILDDNDFSIELSDDDFTYSIGTSEDDLNNFSKFKLYAFEYPSQDVTVELSKILQEKLGYETSVITLKVGSY